ncbi:AraC family transcriptional regulator [Bradyrhizobium sp. WSM 1791]|uniref:AraC family transcriptional regulator n=1 Tax=Bradyrhizobium australiense TaxID=2721161 RepID=A0A7Y4GMS9_9BRAD|nr:AraC family transcriptional regulator [Bradyrhizobium australiense]
MGCGVRRGEFLHQRIASPDESITDIAFELGFTHLSRMASAYRAKFGEKPSATLRGMN